MAPSLLSHIQNLWPFSIRKSDDIKLSNLLVCKLSIPENLKKFVFATSGPDSHATTYILASQNLSKQSAVDAEQLIREVQPKAVICLVSSSALPKIQEEHKVNPIDGLNNVPTSSLGVLKKCLVDKTNREQFEKLARFHVLSEIFGIGLFGHLSAAKKAAEEIGAQFILLEIPYDVTRNVKLEENVSAVNFKRNPEKVVPHMMSLLGKDIPSNCITKSDEIKRDYKAPPFAQSVYLILTDLHDIFSVIPAIKTSLASAQKMLSSINKGEAVDSNILLEVQNFRIAVEALRIAINEAARYPLENNIKPTRLEFSQISSEETSDAICAQAIRSEARKFGSLVVIVDAARLAGLRKHWATQVPSEIANLTDQCFMHYYVKDEHPKEDLDIDNNNLLAKNPSITLGAGATAILKSASLLKTMPIYALIKLATSFKFHASLQFGLEQLQEHKFHCVFSKASTLNFSASGELIRAMAHSLIALAERTSLIAAQTSFYEIMRKRQGRVVKVSPLATFCCSVCTCTGFMMYKDGLKCAAESVPSIPMIASIGRGLESLKQASDDLKVRSGVKVNEAVQALMHNLKK